MLNSFFKGISRPKLMLKIGLIIRRSKKVYRHYKKMPKEYHTRKHKEWMLGHMHLFQKIEEK